MIRTIALSMLLTVVTLSVIYRHHVAALIDPCEAVTEYCSENESLRKTFQCGVDLLSQMVSEHNRIDCYRTWLKLNNIENPTLNRWLNSADAPSSSP